MATGTTRLNEAAVLLAKTEKKISTVSDETGFNNVDYFCRLFNKCSKNSPTSLGGEMNGTSEHICSKNPYSAKETLVLHSLM